MLDHEGEAAAHVVVLALGDLLRDQARDAFFGHGAQERVVEVVLVPDDGGLVHRLAERQDDANRGEVLLADEVNHDLGQVGVVTAVNFGQVQRFARKALVGVDLLIEREFASGGQAEEVGPWRPLAEFGFAGREAAPLRRDDGDVRHLCSKASLMLPREKVYKYYPLNPNVYNRTLDPLPSGRLESTKPKSTKVEGRNQNRPRSRDETKIDQGRATKCFYFSWPE